VNGSPSPSAGAVTGRGLRVDGCEARLPSPVVLSDRRIVVTGASSGIGRGLTLEYARHGARVWAVGRSRDRLEETRASAIPGTVTTISADLTSADGPRVVAESIEGGAVDVVVHAAGLLGPPATDLVGYPDDDWDVVFAANVTSVQRLHAALSPLLATGTRPTVIGVSSTVGREPRAGWGMYAISKHALEAWLGILAAEWPEGRVYSVNPGGTRTPMRAAAVPEEDPADVPAPHEIAPIFLRLAHPDSPEPSGGVFDARDWMLRDPWHGMA
jgi:NAD(P)-dependent dehydrogenase (short-subunit alcohol dehydrogenase family)